MRPDFGERGDREKKFEGGERKKFVMRKKICRFCADPHMIMDYKEPKSLVSFVTERGKMIPRRVTGNCAFHQRRVAQAIRRARVLALLPSGGIIHMVAAA